jgi:stage V sporulation protein G
MDITDIRIHIPEVRRGRRDNTNKVLAYCTVTIGDAFVVRGLRLVDTAEGILLSMPSRKLDDPCPACNRHNRLTARYCNECGGKLDPERMGRKVDGSPILTRDERRQLYEDIAHPVDWRARDEVENAILAEYRRVVEGLSASRT